MFARPESGWHAPTHAAKLLPQFVATTRQSGAAAADTQTHTTPAARSYSKRIHQMCQRDLLCMTAVGTEQK